MKLIFFFAFLIFNLVVSKIYSSTAHRKFNQRNNEAGKYKRKVLTSLFFALESDNKRNVSKINWEGGLFVILFIVMIMLELRFVELTHCWEFVFIVAREFLLLSGLLNVLEKKIRKSLLFYSLFLI